MKTMTDNPQFQDAEARIASGLLRGVASWERGAGSRQEKPRI